MFKNILALIGLAAVLFFSVGYFKNWYTLTWGQDGKLGVQVDTHKVKEGVNDAIEKGKQLLTKPDETPAQEPGLNSFFSPKPAPPQPAPGSSLQLPRNGQ